MDLITLGSKTAKSGFKNENDVVSIFNEWQTNKLAQEWLMAMNYNITEIEYVTAEKIMGTYKADVQVKVTIKLKNLVDYQNIQVKLVSNTRGYNQVDKRWLIKYRELWNIPDNVHKILQYYTGEVLPYKPNTKDRRRMFLTEMSAQEQHEVLDWVERNKYLVVSDILKGRGKFAAEWVLVIQKTSGIHWALKPINIVMNHYMQGEVIITKAGNIRIGRITMQRKGGDAERDTAKMLQFKLDPAELLKL